MLAKVETQPSRTAFAPSSKDPRPSAALKRTLFPVMPRVLDATQVACLFSLIFLRMACLVSWPTLRH